jgi:hypothetical protein
MEHSQDHLSVSLVPPNLTSISICLLFVAISAHLMAQSEKDDQEALRLRQNVVRVEAQHKNSSERGFGFVVGERGGDLYIVTAYHVVANPDEPEQGKVEVRVTFYSDQGSSYSAEVLGTHKPPPHDLAVLRVRTPPGFQMETLCLAGSDKQKRDTPVWSIGKGTAWSVPSVPGGISEGPSSDRILTLDGMSVIRGSSGGPVVAATGLIGILLTDSADNTQALSIDYIKGSLTEWNYPWSLENYDPAKLAASDQKKLESLKLAPTPSIADSTSRSRSRRCGVERWTVKTGTDVDAGKVDLSHPKHSIVADLVSLVPPHPLPVSTRFAPTENTVFTVNAILREYKLESDSDYHLILEDESGNTMVAEIPSPDCVGPTSPFSAEIASARAKFDAYLPATSTLHQVNMPVQVTGVGFFDFFHGQTGIAPNAIELHPVLDIVFGPSSISPSDFTFSLSPPAATINQGGSVSITISTPTVNSPAADGTVSFVTSQPPTGVTYTITPAEAGRFTLTFTASFLATSGRFPVTVTGTSGQKSHSETVSLSVVPKVLPVAELQQWEYRSISASSEQDLVNQANSLGNDRWEIINLMRNQSSAGYIVFFKRVKAPF